MSILSKTTSENTGPSFREFKKQASFFLKEKIKTARLALTDVTPAQLYVSFNTQMGMVLLSSSLSFFFSTGLS